MSVGQLFPLGSVLSVQRLFATLEDHTPFQEDLGSLFPLRPELRGQAWPVDQKDSWMLVPCLWLFPPGTLPSL